MAAIVMQPLANSLTPAASAAGFLLTLGAVLSAHVLPLAWLLSTANSSPPTIQPPQLSGILLHQPASTQQNRTQPQSTPPVQQPRPVAAGHANPKTERPVAKPRQASPEPPKSELTKPEKTFPNQVEPPPETKMPPLSPGASAAEQVTQSVADLAAAHASSAVSAVPVSTPVRNASAHYNAPPVYPKLSRKLREQGTVVLELTVLANGSVAEVQIVSSSGYPRLDHAALRAVQQWQYHSARRNGQPIDYRYRQPVEFSLTSGVH